MNKREQKIVKFYAHDYRDTKMNESELKDMLSGMVAALNCKHECISNCRSNGCNCECGGFHL